MLNINYGCNKELLEACRPLADYSLFVETVRKYLKENTNKGEAVRGAIDALSEDSELRRFLKLHEKEVSDMCLSEYNESEERELLRQEFLEIGKEQGRKEGLSEGLKKGLSEGRKMEAERMDRLVSELLKTNRVDDLKKATSDSEFKNKLFHEFKL